MKALFYAQLNPRKTLRQLVADRDAYRLLWVAALIIALGL